MNVINSFPGYQFIEFGDDGQPHNMYRGTDIGFGGYVYHEAGVYTDVALLDIASQHPSSIVSMNAFGEYTKNFKDLLDARIAIKHGDFDKARTMLGGKLAKYLTDESQANDLSKALKLPINGSYGMTAAKFDNPMRDIRNKNNFIALKGALFMRTLQDEIIERGFRPIHFKTDSVKVANATPEIIQFIMEFGKRYGYNFEHEATYDRMCLVNGSTYIAKYASVDWCISKYGYAPGDNAKAEKKGELWTATAKQFQVPYVFKTLFSKEPITFEDTCETFEVKTAIYVDMNENLPDVSEYEKELEKLQKDIRDPKSRLNTSANFEADLHKTMARIAELENLIQEGHDRNFVGKVGNFCPVKPGYGGGVLVRQATTPDGKTKYTSVTGTLKPDKTPYRWLESEVVKTLGKENDIDKSYYRKLVDDAVEAISQYGDFERFVADEPYIDISTTDHPQEEDLPWYTPEELEAFALVKQEGLSHTVIPDIVQALQKNNQSDALKAQ